MTPAKATWQEPRRPNAVKPRAARRYRVAFSAERVADSPPQLVDRVLQNLVR
jgi:hypothetical protein